MLCNQVIVYIIVIIIQILLRIFAFKELEYAPTNIISFLIGPIIMITLLTYMCSKKWILQANILVGIVIVLSILVDGYAFTHMSELKNIFLSQNHKENLKEKEQFSNIYENERLRLHNLNKQLYVDMNQEQELFNKSSYNTVECNKNINKCIKTCQDGAMHKIEKDMWPNLKDEKGSPLKGVPLAARRICTDECEKNAQFICDHKGHVEYYALPGLTLPNNSVVHETNNIPWNYQ